MLMLESYLGSALRSNFLGRLPKYHFKQHYDVAIQRSIHGLRSIENLQNYEIIPVMRSTLNVHGYSGWSRFSIAQSWDPVRNSCHKSIAPSRIPNCSVSFKQLLTDNFCIASIPHASLITGINKFLLGK